MPRKLWSAPHVLFVLLAVIGVWTVVVFTTPHGPHDRVDFIGSYSSAKILLSNRHSLYSIPLQFAVQRASGSQIYAPWAHPAPEALLFVPLTAFSWFQAFAIWTAVSVGCFLLCCYLMAEELGGLRSIEHYALMALCGIPALEGLWLGQDHALFLMVWVFAWRALKKDADGTAGALIGLSLIRYQFGLPMLLFLLVLRRWRLLAAAAATGSMVLGGWFLIVGRGLVSSYAGMLHVMVQTTDVLEAPSMLDIRGFCSLITPAHGSLAASIASLAMLAWALIAVRKLRSEDAFAFSMVVSLILDPHAFAYELVILFIPMTLFLRKCPAAVMIGWAFCALAFATQISSETGLWALFCPVLIAWAIWMTRVPRDPLLLPAADLASTAG